LDVTAGSVAMAMIAQYGPAAPFGEEFLLLALVHVEDLISESLLA